jgi:hypothetical protein
MISNLKFEIRDFRAARSWLFDIDRFMMFHRGWRRKVLLHVASPDREIRGIPEGNRMVLQAIPPHQQAVAAGKFDGSLEFNSQEPFRAQEKFVASRHAALESRLRSLFYFDLRNFQNHVSFLSAER